MNRENGLPLTPVAHGPFATERVVKVGGFTTAQKQRNAVLWQARR